MKTVALKFGGEPIDGDLAVVAYTTPRGGMSYATYKVRGEQVRAEINGAGEPVKVVEPGDSPAFIAQKIAEVINSPRSEYCPGQFSARAIGDMLVINCSDSVDDVRFIAQFNGGSGTIMEIA